LTGYDQPSNTDTVGGKTDGKKDQEEKAFGNFGWSWKQNKKCVRKTNAKRRKEVKQRPLSFLRGRYVAKGKEPKDNNSLMGQGKNSATDETMFPQESI